MKIPDKPGDRLDFVQMVIQTCQASQQARQAGYRTLKQYYLYGQETSTTVNDAYFGTVNKIFPHIDKQLSILYSPDSTQFNVELSRNVEAIMLKRADVLGSAVTDSWHNSDADTRIQEALRWSMVYGTELVKVRPRGQQQTIDLIDPHYFGVWREDLMGLDAQEAYFHEYRITKSELEYQLCVAGVKNAAAIVAAAVENMGQPDEQVTQPIDRIVTSTVLPMAQGQINTYIGSRLGYAATLKQPMVRMYELYVFDDAIDDMRVFTCAHPWIPIFDRPMEKMFLKHDSPIVQLCPMPTHGYFWGIAPVERLITLQMIRNTRWDQVQHIMEMQANPANFGTGSLNGTAEEIQDALATPGGLVISDTPNGDMKQVAPQPPEDLFAEVNYIDGQFDDAVGTTDLLSGKGEAGVRSDGHAQQLMRAGSSRVKARALLIERQLENVATLILKVMKKYSDAVYYTDDGLQFLAAEFTEEFMVRVDSHSSSPVFMQDNQQLAFALFKARAITRERLIEMLSITNKALLKQDLKDKIEPAEARAAAQQRQLELATHKVTKIGGKK